MMDEIQIRDVVKETVKETLTSLGFESDPTEVQKNLAYLSKIRRSSESLSMVIRNTTVGIVVTGLMYGFWETLRSSLHK